MKTITFFSYKGGNGRTLTAANFAVYLSKLGLKVAIMDFDLDAPGVDSKFPEFTLQRGQLGLIDYILKFQREGTPPGPLDDIYCTVPVDSPRAKVDLGLIPAGDYLSQDYPAKLNELNWSVIFSPQRDGVAFFQLFLKRIERELDLDVLIVDSRTGFSEIGGLCTQQLADETVILSSLAREGIKMTRHLARMIRESEVAKQLNRVVETKVVVCRVPRPRDIDKLKAGCCKVFDVDDRRLFFLFSYPGLEREEFLAMLDTRKDQSLVSNYVQLFQGLNVDIAEKSIQNEISRTERGILSCTVEEADASIREMVALYPHPDVYRRAMRYFKLRSQPVEATHLALRLLDLLPADSEANLHIVRILFEGRVRVIDEDIQFYHHAFGQRVPRKIIDELDARRASTIAEHAYQSGMLSVSEKVQLADLFEDLESNERAFDISNGCLMSGEIEDEDVRANAVRIAARTALKTGRSDDAVKLVSEIPINSLRGELANLAIQQKIDTGEHESAFEVVKIILSQQLDVSMVELAFKIAKQLGRRKELKELIRTHPQIRKGAIRPNLSAVLTRLGITVPKKGGSQLLHPRQESFFQDVEEEEEEDG